MALMEDAENPRDREQPYEPPRAEDIDTTHQPAEVVAGVPRFSTGSTGVQESERWH